MARPPINSQPRAPAPKKQIAVAEMQRGIERLQGCIKNLEAFDIASMTATHPPEISGLQVSVKGAIEKSFGEETADFRRFSEACNLQWEAGYAVGDYPALSDYQEGIRERISHSIAILRVAIHFLEEEIADAAVPATRKTTQAALPPDLSKVFVVHGHDAGAREAIARFLERIELEAIILHEQPDQGLTIIEKFETYATQVGFAVVLLTPDDLGGQASSPAQASRARQNVIFELGYFAGKLGRGRACLLRKGDVEIPSDLYGVIYTEMDDGDGWKLKLARELNAAGLKFDANKVFG